MTEQIIEVQKDANVDEEKKWSVYMHTSPSNKKYIGITSLKPERRFDHGNGYLKKRKNGEYGQPAMAHAILKYPDFDNEWTHEILYIGLTKLEAEIKEKQLITEYHTQDSMYGYNISPGGNVMATENNPMHNKSLKDFLSEEEYEQWKTNISIGVSKFYENHPEECKKRSDRTKALWQNQEFRDTFSNKMSGANNPFYENHMFAGEGHPMYGKHHTEESKKKNRESHLGKNTGVDNVTSKPLFCPELNRIFWGGKQVKNEFGISEAHISDCCKGKRKHAGTDPITHTKLSWLFCKDYTDKNGTLIYGAISSGYITQEDLDNYLSNLKQKGNDINGTMEKE